MALQNCLLFCHPPPQVWGHFDAFLALIRSFLVSNSQKEMKPLLHLLSLLSASPMFPLLCFIPANFGQSLVATSQSSSPSSPPPPPSSPIVLDCFYCRHSLRERDVYDRLDQHPECLSFEFFANQSQFRRTCTPMEPFCTTIVNNLNGFFADLRRDCTERCRPGCEESGYGIFVRKCTRCCQTPLCNSFDGRKFLLNEMNLKQLMAMKAAKYKNLPIPADLFEELEDEDDTSSSSHQIGNGIMPMAMLIIIMMIAFYSNLANRF